MNATTTFDAATFRQVLGNYPTGVSIVTSAGLYGEPLAGMTAGTFTSVSLDPPLVAFLPAKTSSSWPVIEQTGRFCINVLSAEQEGLCKSFSISGGDKFKGVSWRPSSAGLPVLDGVVAWVECDLKEVIDAGDHFIAVGQVVGLGANNDREPLIFHRSKFNRPLLL